MFIEEENVSMASELENLISEPPTNPAATVDPGGEGPPPFENLPEVEEALLRREDLVDELRSLRREEESAELSNPLLDAAHHEHTHFGRNAVLRYDGVKGSLASDQSDSTRRVDPDAALEAIDDELERLDDWLLRAYLRYADQYFPLPAGSFWVFGRRRKVPVVVSVDLTPSVLAYLKDIFRSLGPGELRDLRGRPASSSSFLMVIRSRMRPRRCCCR
jgi:hypothetical protein